MSRQSLPIDSLFLQNLDLQLTTSLLSVTRGGEQKETLFSAFVKYFEKKLT
jgi:hypothetical protein